MILVEPLVNPGVEAQVVGRVHRIGQTRKTFVHSFVTKDTVEENVYRLNRERAANVDASTFAGTSKAAAKEDQKFSIRCFCPNLLVMWSSHLLLLAHLQCHSLPVCSPHALLVR